MWFMMTNDDLSEWWGSSELTNYEQSWEGKVCKTVEVFDTIRSDICIT